jgi:NH3-dependent NAD+ synthetase|uniref:Uncharacterized protein n=1 Tax=Ignisphaera aggregans TaxID=334771 RepID=A0A7J2U501_9CREN
MSLDVTAILNRIYEKLLSLSKEIDCAIACISGGVDSTTSAVVAMSTKITIHIYDHPPQQVMQHSH